ncbi:MAG: MEDS domain-containing protein [Ignavibacteria bacterium]
MQNQTLIKNESRNEVRNELRSTGIEIIGDTPWGTHFCNFFETKHDMLDILVPFFKAGLEHNEYCVYITSDPVTAKEAESSLRNGIPDFEKYLKENKIEILPHTEWYLKSGKFDAKDVFSCWDDKLALAISSGYAGLRINGNATWLDRNLWDTFIDYERDLNDHIRDRKIIVMCTYPLDKCIATDVLDVAHVHKVAIAKRKGEWEVFETPDTKRTKAQILKKNEQLSNRIIIGTQQLKEAGIELERSEANLRSIFENNGTGLILLDPKMNILLFNGIANELAKVSFGKPYIYGENMHDLIEGLQKEEFKNNCDSVLEGKQIMFEHSYHTPEGSVKWFYTRMFPIKIDDETNIGVCISTEDITARKNTEFEKDKITSDLLLRNKDLEQFSYMVSHNLRAPVANIIGFSGRVLQNSLDDEKKLIFIEQINASALILDAVIRDLNIILQMKTDTTHKKEEVKFSAIVDSIRKSIQSIIETENAVIKTDFTAAESIKGNRVYLYSIFLNLITNSIKYHQPGISPAIEILTKTENGKLYIIFKDNGLGIDLNKNRDKVFRLYKRFHPDIEGRGMGLFMVKNQVDILGGKINIDSKVNKGTIFTIELNQ